MKKQFFRVKQLADQTFLRADRSEGLNHDELKKADYKVEYISKALSEITKKLPTCSNSNEALEKRKKKYNEYNLGITMLDLALPQEENERLLLHSVLKECGLTETGIAENQAICETHVEQNVSAPLNTILEKELPNIFKQKKQLNRYILDKDSATNRYQNASKNGAQKENLKEDMEEADIKVDQSRDVLASEMFGLLRRENEICTYLLHMLKMQRSYHESALKSLNGVIPELEQKIVDSEVKPIFGCDLREHLKVTKRKLAYPLEVCVVSLMELGMSEEGLFRIAGSASRVKRLRLSLDSGCFSLPLIQEYRDVHVLASALKSYLRELPEPLLTYALYEEWIDSMKHPDDKKVAVLQDIISKLPIQNRDNLAFLMHFLAKLSKHPENKMTSSNISIVIAPNLLWGHNEEMNINMKNCAPLTMIVELFINNVDYLFPDDMMKITTIKKGDILDGDFFHRPEVQSIRASQFDFADYQASTASPKPTLRKKTKPAPAPPSQKHEDSYSDNSDTSSYPSGSSTLSRSHRIRSSEHSRPKSKIEDDDDIKIIKHDEKVTHTVKSDLPNPTLVSLDNAKMADHKYVQQTTTAVQMTKSKPVQQITAQITNVDVSTNTPKANHVDNIVKPVAAPRTSIASEAEKPHLSEGIETMSKSLNSIDIEGEMVQVRHPSKDELFERPGKPAIPVRPASLRVAAPRTLIDPEPTIQKTQCSVYNMPYKQQPSYVNIQTRLQNVGHDNQMAEKQKFLGQQPAPRSSLENKFNDINFNCDSKTLASKPEVPSKPPIMKSNEKLNLEPSERVNGNPKTSHNRTRSDGNIMDIHSDAITPTSLLQPPASPRSLNKPSQPPPPPPTVNKAKVEPEITDF